MGLRRTFFTNFSAGELTAKMQARLDLSAYQNGAAQIRNFRQLAQGGLMRRPGTTFVDTLVPTGAVQQADFVFNDDESYNFIFSNARMDIYRKDGTASQVSTSMDWTTAMIGKLSVIQAGDFMWVAHKDLVTKQIQRTAVDTFAITDYTFDQDASADNTFQPYTKFEAGAMTLDVSAYSGVGLTLTADSGGFFTSDHIGALVRYAGSEIEITAVASALSATGTTRKDLPPTHNLTVAAGDELKFTVGQFVTGEDTGVSKGEGVVSTLASALISVVVTGDHDGFNGVDTLIGPTGTVAVTGTATASAPDATTEWDEQVFSDARGYARVVHLHDQRLIFGGSRDLPNDFFASRPGQFFNHDIGVGDDGDAIHATIFERSIVEIVGMASLRNLQIFTAQQEFFVDTGAKGTLTPDPANLSFKKQTRYGAAEIAPQEFDGATLFVTKSLSNIREFLFDDLENAFRAQSVSFLAGELIDTPVDMAVQLEDTDQPEQYAYVVNADGTIAVFLSLRNENISAWTGWSTPGGDGTVKSVQSVDGRMFIITERTTNSVTALHLEYFDATKSLDMAAVDTSGSPTTTFGPFAHLKNETVAVRSGNLFMGFFTLDASGNLDLVDAENAVEEVTVGFDYTPTLKTLPPEFQLPDGISVGEPRRVVKVVLDLVSTLGITVQGNSLDLRQVTDDMSLDPVPVTTRETFFIRGWDELGQITITQSAPLDLILNGVLIEVEI